MFMKKCVCIAAVLSVFAVASYAGGFSVGGHGAYTVGGDIESEEFGYGAQVGIDLVENVSLELSGTMFSDEVEDDEFGGLDIDTTHIALSVRFDIPVTEALAVYVGGGASYNMIDVDAPSIESLIATAMDPAEAAAYDAFVAAGGTLSGGVDVDVDDSFGYHACAGISLALSDSVELFGEYRFTWMDIEGEINAELTAMQGGVTVEQVSESAEIEEDSYNFGLARVGVNILL